MEDRPLLGVRPESFITVTHRRPLNTPYHPHGGTNEWDGIENGYFVARRRGGDTVVSRGLNYLTRLLGSATGVYTRVALSAIGTGVGSHHASNTVLGSEVYRGTYSWSKDSATGSASLDRTFTIGSTYAIRESALYAGTRPYSGTSFGTLYSRGTFAVRNVVASDTLTLNYTTGFTSA